MRLVGFQERAEDFVAGIDGRHQVGAFHEVEQFESGVGTAGVGVGAEKEVEGGEGVLKRGEEEGEGWEVGGGEGVGEEAEGGGG